MCKVFLYHEGKVQILPAITNIDVSVLRGRWQMEEGQAGPQQAAQHQHSAGTFQLETPRPCAQRTLQVND